MELFFSALINVLFLGLAYGMVLYVISVGLSITMGLMGVINLAHGVFAMGGGYVFVTALARYHIPFPIALFLAFAVIALISLILERYLYRAIYTAPELEQVLFSIALILIAIAIAKFSFGTLQQPVILPDTFKQPWVFWGKEFPSYRVFVIAFSAVLILILWIGIEKTRWGVMLRATVDHRVMAQSVGINTQALFSITFALGSGLAGLGGALGADIIAIQPTYPFEQLVYFLVVVAVGGVGSLRGPFFAAIVIGVLDTSCKYWLPEFGGFFIYIATIALLLWRPMGLMGKNV